MDPIDVKGLSMAAIIQRLHNGTSALGIGRFNDLGRDMTLCEAEEIVKERKEDVHGGIRFDYIAGRPIKVDFRDGFLHRPDLYDRDCPTGHGSCADIIRQLRAETK